MEPITATMRSAIIPYRAKPIVRKSIPPRNEPMTPMTKLATKPKPFPRRIRPASHPAVSPMSKNKRKSNILCYPCCVFVQILIRLGKVKKEAILIRR